MCVCVRVCLLGLYRIATKESSKCLSPNRYDSVNRPDPLLVRLHKFFCIPVSSLLTSLSRCARASYSESQTEIEITGIFRLECLQFVVVVVFSSVSIDNNVVYLNIYIPTL